MALIPEQLMSRTGVVISPGSPTISTGNDTFVNNGNQLLVIFNNGVTDIDIEVYIKIYPESGGLTVLKKVVWVNSGKIVIVDRLPPQTYSDPVTGLATLTIQTGRPVTNITFILLKLGVN